MQAMKTADFKTQIGLMDISLALLILYIKPDFWGFLCLGLDWR